MNARIKLIVPLLLLVVAQGCVPAQPAEVDVAPAATSTVTRPPATATSTPLPPPTATPVATEVLPTPQPAVTITATGGTLYIRRGPGLEYDRIGALTKGSSASIIGQDVLSKWVQITIPDSERTGWVSNMSSLTRIDGDLSSVPDFTYTDWAKPAYVKNCTEHEILIQPGEIRLLNFYTNGESLNEAQINPGVYTVYDLFVPGEPAIETIDVREGVTVYITVNGLGVSHKCP